MTVDIILSGRRGKKIYHKFGHNVVAEFDKLDLTTKIDEILPMAQLAVADYVAGKYDKILVAYTDFKSAIQQIPKIKQLLPLTQTRSGERDPLLTSPSAEEEGDTPSPSQRRGLRRGFARHNKIMHLLQQPTTKPTRQPAVTRY